ncbi:hypothetical protein ACFQS7_21825 [Dankookia sp. GCM10030260]|uniref:hypothetical protein n=1 Tax=Dankookia sp. GCM10030260 TaxID=3273390 RepID=UPI0036224148
MRHGALMLLLLAAGCAEMRQAPPAIPTAALAPNSADGVRGAIEAMAPAFADRARGLADRPAEAAQAAAQLEFVTAAIPRDPRYAPIPEGIRRELLLARQELRDALGTADDATPEAVVPALLAAAGALRTGDRARAARALPAPIFRPGGTRSVDRLGELGPLPQAAIASELLQREVARLDAEGRWLAGRPVDASGNLITTFGLGGNTGVGY